ncbi:MAG: carboxy terminal-processing peptidase [Halieaceae bacterium]|jgi:carboxyl-terminal processing protease|nr:carboxy terminal-processing peptidase [Halieaceae bacterium]
MPESASRRHRDHTFLTAGVAPTSRQFIAAALALLLALAAVLPGSARALVEPDTAPLAPSEGMAKTAIELVDKLETRHYSKRQFDDALSSELLDAYLDSLDPTRSFLYQSDIDAFENRRLLLDDEFARGDLGTGFEIFNLYQQRIAARLEGLVEGLPALLESMDFSVDENLSLEPEKEGWPVDAAEADERWRKQVKTAVLSLRIAGKPEEEILPTLEKRYQNQLKRIAQYNAQDVFQVYANALTELYDPHTNYLSPRTSENFNINMSLSLEGIGAVLQLQDEYTKVSRIVPAGPADKQGQLRPSDRIVAVAQGDDGPFEDVLGWRLDEVVQLIRGPKDTTVRLQVLPANAASPDERKEIRIVRNKVKLEEQSAKKEVIEVPRGDKTIKLGVIDIPTFYIDFEGMRRGEPDFKSTTRDVKRLLDELMAEQVDGVIIDLRNNGGGSLQEANDLTGLFIEYGPTVQIRHSSRKVFRDGKRLRTPYYDGPLAVLINRLSASASEIFAGAIQDYQRGIVVGSQSFGKGTVQTLIPLPEGQLKLTESKFYRISGDSTQHRGVIPDVTFPSRYAADEIGESTLDHALDWDQITPVRHRKYHDIPSLVPYLTDLHQARARSNPDFIYLEDSVALADETRNATVLPLNEEKRLALREQRKVRALEIENKRRLAKGLEPLDSLDDDTLAAADMDDTGGEDLEGAAQSGVDGAALSTGTDAEGNASDDAGEPALADADNGDEDVDVLLVEAGNVLVDALAARSEMLATNHQSPFEAR